MPSSRNSVPESSGSDGVDSLQPMMEALQISAGPDFGHVSFKALLRPCLFITEVFEIYRSFGDLDEDTCGLYDYSPPGYALQANTVDL